MRILIHGLNFSPELTGIGKYTGEMAEWLAGAGHEVRVVTAPPYYPEWRIADGYAAGAYRLEDFAGIRVWRCPIWVPSYPGGGRRLAHLASFALSSLPVMLRQAAWRPDVVWVVAPALFCAPAAWMSARLCGARVWLHIQDFEVDAAFNLGLLKGSLLRKLASGLERWVLRRFDRVSSISSRMMDRLSVKGVDPARAFFFPNWVDLARIAPGCQPGEAGTTTYRAELGIPEDAIVVLYSGNMGAKQGLEILPEIARRLVSREDIWFIFCGDGAGRANLESACSQFPRVRLLPIQSPERLGDLLRSADIHLLPQRADAADLVMPSKLTGILASGRPVVAGARQGSGLAEVVAGRGIVVEPESSEAFAEAVELLAGNGAMRMELGLRAREYAEDHLDRDVVLGRFEAALREMCASDKN